MSSLDLFFRRYYGPEFTASLVREWLQALAVQTLFIERGSPWENGYVESFNGKLRDALLARETFYTLTEAKVLIERWRWQYTRISDFTVVPYPLEHASCPDCAGFRHEEPATEGDTQWVNDKPSPFSSRSTGF